MGPLRATRTPRETRGALTRLKVLNDSSCPACLWPRSSSVRLCYLTLALCYVFYVFLALFYVRL